MYKNKKHIGFQSQENKTVLSQSNLTNELCHHLSRTPFAYIMGGLDWMSLCEFSIYNILYFSFYIIILPFIGYGGLILLDLFKVNDKCWQTPLSLFLLSVHGLLFLPLLSLQWCSSLSIPCEDSPKFKIYHPKKSNFFYSLRFCIWLSNLPYPRNIP